MRYAVARSNLRNRIGSVSVKNKLDISKRKKH